jgi:hypothetical protein
LFGLLPLRENGEASATKAQRLLAALVTSHRSGWAEAERLSSCARPLAGRAIHRVDET